MSLTKARRLGLRVAAAVATPVPRPGRTALPIHSLRRPSPGGVDRRGRRQESQHSRGAARQRGGLPSHSPSHGLARSDPVLHLARRAAGNAGRPAAGPAISVSQRIPWFGKRADRGVGRPQTRRGARRDRRTASRRGGPPSQVRLLRPSLLGPRGAHHPARGGRPASLRVAGAIALCARGWPAASGRPAASRNHPRAEPP